ncbi:serine/threonine-protein kinase [Nonomuraea basaltis]|uniref:serine/threonine-protein kinase n=1 Tax=Nonomuraea basaltis TaxID=2495887 RepID=UPI00110C4769|nr:serine/threonine-protein kinase [Nonomuraea basaltis]TMR91880.1 serine/threonine protein kinase [Nonomuraea basaltis]
MSVEPLRVSDPRQVGKYRLLGRLGVGGMGEVFFGLTPGRRPVAVKLIHQVHAANLEFRRRFRLEIEAARKVNGLHTAGVVDADPAADPPWMVTAFIAGPSLQRALAEHGPFPDVTLRVLGAGIAEALEAIHEAGLIHRDLKPSNILLAADGPRVIDFGIARATDASQTTAMVGTPGFMSPEMLTGEPLTPASDIFAFGLVLAHAAGVHPFGEGPQQALSYRIIHLEPRLAGLEQGLGELIARCLAKDSTQRPTPTQVLQALAPPMMGSSWLPAPVQNMVDQQTRLEPSTPQDSAEVPGRTAPHSLHPAAQPTRRTWPPRFLSLLAAAVLVPSLALLVLGSQGQSGGCSLFAASANAAVLSQHRITALAEDCDKTIPRAAFLLGTIGTALSATLAVRALRRHRER